MKSLLQLQTEFNKFIHDLDNEYYLFDNETNDLNENDTYRVTLWFDESKLYLELWFDEIDTFNEDNPTFQIDFDRENVDNDALINQLLNDILSAVKEDIETRIDEEVKTYEYRIKDLNLNKSFLEHLGE